MKALLLSALAALSFIFVESCSKESITENNASVVSNFSSDSIIAKSPIIGRQFHIAISTGDYTYPTSQALLWLPKNYRSGKSYPLIIALNGTGENNTNIYSLLHPGTVAQRIAAGWNGSAKNPVTHANTDFIVFTPQCPVKWGWSAPQVKHMLSILEQTFHIDKSRVYLTGFSAGGWGLWSCITDDESLCQQFAAIGPVSTASADHPDKITNVDKYGIACWNICGTQDAFYTNATNYTNIINSNNPPIPAVLTGLPGVGHNAWVYAYDPTWSANGNTFYEWLLKYHK